MASEYKSYNNDKLEELSSRFIITGLSYSKLSAFARNQKAFEMNYVYGIRSRKAATAIAGTAYHAALRIYFYKRKEGELVELPYLEQIAFEEIDETLPNEWKLQKTLPTVEDCIKKANATVTSLLRNFFKEIFVYDEELDEIIGVEFFCNEWLTVNDMDVPLPFSLVVDLIIRTKDGRHIIIDHKSKASHSDDDGIALTIREQAII
mgnify:CR=1 FL=1